MRTQEVLRKVIHMAGGATAPALVALLGWTGSIILALFLLTYLLVAWDEARRGVRLPIVGAAIERTSRPDDPTPSGALEFLLAALLLAVLVPLPYSLGAMGALGFGDGVAALAGQRWGRRPLPWNPGKTWVGLACGVLVGVPAYAAFAFLGAQLQLRGFATAANLWGPPVPAAWSLLFIVAGFLIAHGVARWAVAAHRAERTATASHSRVATCFLVALVPGVTFLLVAPHFLGGPVLAPWGGHGPVTRGALLGVPVVAMLVESALRGHDNLAVAAVAGPGAWLLVGALGGA